VPPGSPLASHFSDQSWTAQTADKKKRREWGKTSSRPKARIGVRCRTLQNRILRRADIQEIADLTGGFGAWQAADLQKTKPAL
jgi:hypothetical protein